MLKRNLSLLTSAPTRPAGTGPEADASARRPHLLSPHLFQSLPPQSLPVPKEVAEEFRGG